jgi:hypothetical protein
METSRRWYRCIVVVALAAGLVVGALLLRPGASQAQAKDGAGGARYTVVFTEGTNLCVTDNQTNTVYFYTVDPGKEPGSELKLRATVDLSQVGKDVINPSMRTRK